MIREWFYSFTTVIPLTKGRLDHLSSFVQVNESSSWNEREVLLGDQVVLLFVEILVGMDGGGGIILRDGNGFFWIW